MKYLKIFTDFTKDMEPISDTEAGRLFRAMLLYAETGEESDLRGNERFLWGTCKRGIDTQRDSYNRQCEINAENIKNRWIRIDTNRYEPIRNDTKLYESYQEKKRKENKREEKTKTSIKTKTKNNKFKEKEEEKERALKMLADYLDI